MRECSNLSAIGSQPPQPHAERDTVVNFSREKKAQKGFIPSVALGMAAPVPAVACMGGLKYHLACHPTHLPVCNIARLPVVYLHAAACYDISNLGLFTLISQPLLLCITPRRHKLLRDSHQAWFSEQNQTKPWSKLETSMTEFPPAWRGLSLPPVPCGHEGTPIFFSPDVEKASAICLFGPKLRFATKEPNQPVLGLGPRA